MKREENERSYPAQLSFHYVKRLQDNVHFKIFYIMCMQFLSAYISTEMVDLCGLWMHPLSYLKISYDKQVELVFA